MWHFFFKFQTLKINFIYYLHFQHFLYDHILNMETVFLCDSTSQVSENFISNAHRNIFNFNFLNKTSKIVILTIFAVALKTKLI
jgi:hypothetical protein